MKQFDYLQKKNWNVYNPFNEKFIIPFAGRWVLKSMIDSAGLSVTEKEMIDCLMFVYFYIDKTLFQFNIFI